jgi:hypothetical protein
MGAQCNDVDEHTDVYAWAPPPVGQPGRRQVYAVGPTHLLHVRRSHGAAGELQLSWPYIKPGMHALSKPFHHTQQTGRN